MALVAWEIWEDKGSRVSHQEIPQDYFSLWTGSFSPFLSFSFSPICILFLPARDSFLFWVIQLLGEEIYSSDKEIYSLTPSPTLNVKPEK